MQHTASAPSSATSPISVTEYDHFVSFCSDDGEGRRVVVQYRRDQVWIDDNGVWQVKAAEQPFYTVQAPARRRREVNLSPEILSALGGR